MKNIVIGILIMITVNVCSAQAVYDLTGNFRTVKKEQLAEAKQLNDLILHFPENWITSYKKVEITTINNGQAKTEAGTDKVLTSMQRINLSTADLLSSILIKISYVYINALNGKAENLTMEVSLYVSPDSNAKFENGKVPLFQFIRQTIFGNLQDTIPRRMGMVSVKFTVNENGEIINSKIFKSSGDLFTDARVLQAINNMPKWKAAEHKGEKIKQDFLFSFGGC